MTTKKILTPEQLSNLKEIRNETLRRRFGLYYSLPEDLQEWLFSEETANRLYSITQEKNILNLENARRVARIVGLVVLGEVPVKDFIRRLASDLGIDQPKAAALAKDINEQIFQPVRNSLMAVHGLNADSTRTSTDRATVPTEVPSSKLQAPTNPQPTTNIQYPVSNIHSSTPHPLTLDEIEELEAERSVKESERAETREELIERLRKAKEEQQQKQSPPRTVVIPPARPTKPLEQKLESPPNGGQAPSINSGQAKVTAWNGRTIDLSRIPPRRKSPRIGGNGNDLGEMEIHEV